MQEHAGSGMDSDAPQGALPEITVLIPHRPPLLLLDSVLEDEKDRCVAQTTVDPNAWYAEADGSMPGWCGLELMAQAIAAHSGNRKRLQQKPVKFGYLLGTNDYRCLQPTFPAGAVLTVTVEHCFGEGAGLNAFTCEVQGQGQVLAQAVLKVYEEP